MYKQKMRLIFNGILASLLAVLFMVPAAYAQDDEDTFMLEEITVTAEKRDTDLQKTAVSIQTVDGEELVTEAKQRIDEIMQGVVGVSSQGSQVGTDFYMRGLGTANPGPVAGGTNQSAVAVLIDGVYQNRGEVVRGGTLDMAQAEVMRGTQSTTLGGSSLAGAVSLVSNNPVFDYEGSGSLGFGNYHLVTTQGVLNVPITDDQALRVAYGSEQRDGYISSGAGDSDQTNARLKYRWQPTEAVNLVATINQQVIGGNGVDAGVLSYYGYWEGYDSTNADNYDNTMGNPELFGHVDGVKYDERDDPWDDGYPEGEWPNNPYRHTTITQYSADLDWDLGFGTLTVTPSYQQAHFTSQEPPRGTSFRSEDRQQETTQFDAQLTSSSDFFFEWLGGVYYYDTTYSGTIRTTEYETVDGEYTGNYTWSWEKQDPNSQTTYAAYANVTYPILDALRLDAGLRYTRDEKLTRSVSNVAGTAYSPSSAYVFDDPLEAKWDEITYRVGGEYDVSDNAMVYALYATGYQPGQITMMGQASATEKQTLDQYTAGFKSRLLNNRLQLNVEGFWSTYYNRALDGELSYYSDNWNDATNNQTTCGTQGPPGADSIPYEFGTSATYGEYGCYNYGQGATVPEMTSKGVDLEINWLITENDRIDASAEYLESVQSVPEFNLTLSDIEAYAAAEGVSDELAATLYNGLLTSAQSYDGLTLQNSPEWSANFSYSHIFDLTNGSTLTPKFNLEYKSEYWSLGGGPGANIAEPGDSVQDAYALYNVFLNWTSSDNKFTISSYVKNIENKPILTNYGAEAMPTVSLAAPRTFGAVLTVKL